MPCLCGGCAQCLLAQGFSEYEVLGPRPDPLSRERWRHVTTAWRNAARMQVYRAARRLGLLGDPFVEATANALGDISLDEALAALERLAQERDRT